MNLSCFSESERTKERMKIKFTLRAYNSWQLGGKRKSLSWWQRLLLKIWIQNQPQQTKIQILQVHKEKMTIQYILELGSMCRALDPKDLVKGKFYRQRQKSNKTTNCMLLNCCFYLYILPLPPPPAPLYTLPGWPVYLFGQIFCLNVIVPHPRWAESSEQVNILLPLFAYYSLFIYVPFKSIIYLDLNWMH